MLRIFSVILCALVLQACSNKNSSEQYIAPKQLQVEYRHQPLGIDVKQPRFSWQMAPKKDVRNQSQSAYQLVVSDETGKVVWDTGRVESSISLHISYAGAPLTASTRYDWKVTVWDEDNTPSSTSSWFETGLMNSSIAAWQGAEWIGVAADDIAFNAHYLPLFDIEVELHIASGSQRAGVVFAANDPRLLDPYKNIYQLKNQRNQSYFKVELDIGPVAKQQPAMLNFYRAGYTPEDDAAVPVASFTIDASLINASNVNSPHHLLIHNEYGTVTVQIDGRGDAFSPARQLVGFEHMVPPMVFGPKVQLNPLGDNHDYITYGMLGEIGFAVPANQAATFKGLKVKNLYQPRNALFVAASDKSTSIFANSGVELDIDDNGITLNGGDSGAFVVADPSKNSAPMLRRGFAVDKPIRKARLYATARGIYEMYLNGQRVGDGYFNPGLTQYNKTHQYQAYDVTELLVKGNNVLGVLMSEGWWSGQLSYGNTWHGFGDRQAFLGQLVITFNDGSQQTIVSSPQEWQYSVDGPIRYSSLNMGEVYDASRESNFDKWSQAGFDVSSWSQVEVVSLSETQSENVRPSMSLVPRSWDFSTMNLVGQIDEPARIFKILTATSVSEVRPGVYVYDLGQNIVGVPRIAIADGKAGQQVTLRYAEMLYPDMPESGPNVGMIVTENYRAALSQDIYIMRAGQQQYQPYFTSHGFRYIEITGIDAPLPLDAVEGLAMSSIQALSADFATSNAKVNRLWQNLTWSAVDNFLSVPTDCPQRNERMGWSGDINVFSRTATYLTDASPFLSRHLLGMRDIQDPSGRFTDIAPLGGGFGGILWGSAGITVAWENYQQYGDLATLRDHYPSMKNYMTYLASVIDDETGLVMDAQLGDWLGPQNGQLGSAYLATSYYIFALDIMAQTAQILGQAEDAQTYIATRDVQKDFFAETFLMEGIPYGVVGSGPMFNAMLPPFKKQPAATQTAYAVPLALGVIAPELESSMAAELAKVVASEAVDDGGIARPAYSLMTGFIGTAWISKALSDAGYNDEAYRLLTNETYPSWLYSVNQGATTIWERLNGYTVENGFGGNNSMNSFNHYSFGSVGQWMMAYAAGIQREEPGFQRFKLAPAIDRSGSIDWVNAHYDSPYGRIESRWKIMNEEVHYNITIPANTLATIVLPTTGNIVESGKSLLMVEGISNVHGEAHATAMQIGSGSYQFVF